MPDFQLRSPDTDAATPRPCTAVAVVMRRERIDNRWQPWRWVLADVVPQEDGFGAAPRLLLKDEREERWLHPGFKVELFTDDGEGYYLNVSTTQPCFWVVWRMEEEALLAKANESGAYIMKELRQVEGLQNIRGKGLMIGFEVPDHLKGLRKTLLDQYHVFTGEAKPNVVRLLPALNIERKHLDEFLQALRSAVAQLSGEGEAAESKAVQAQ